MLSFPVQPMLATLARNLPTGGEWAFEIKWDGYRNLAFIDSGQARFQSRSGRDVTQQFDEVSGIAAALNSSSAVLDGELVALTSDGTPSFESLQRRDRPIAFYIFDVLQIDEIPTVSLPYLDRRRLLDQLVEPGPHHLVPSYQIGDGAEMAVRTADMGLEGLIAKRVDSTYSPGARSTDWRKVKHRRRTEVVIGGFTQGEGNRSGTLGAVAVGIPSAVGLRFAGKVGTGFDDHTLRHLCRLLSERITDQCPFDPPPTATERRGMTWVHPDLAITVEFAEFSNRGHIRHASFISFATDNDGDSDGG